MKLKALKEKKNDILAQMQTLCEKAQTETRAFTAEETSSYDSLKAEVQALNKTIETIEEARSFDFSKVEKDSSKKDADSVEVRAFANLIKTAKANYTEERANVNMTMGDNGGAVIPESIANRIISRVVELSPILEKSTRYAVKGNL
ncbi:MAG: phage major capsid protein, partial [Selenomonadales bacterium]|nr:phage major capsid protein [Selenomonadales bacterium]